MIPHVDKYGFTTIDEIQGYVYDVFEVVNQCIKNKLFKECVLQINPKTYEFSVCKSNEAVAGNDVYPLTQFTDIYSVTGETVTSFGKVHEVATSYFTFL